MGWMRNSNDKTPTIPVRAESICSSHPASESKYKSVFTKDRYDALRMRDQCDTHHLKSWLWMQEKNHPWIWTGMLNSSDEPSSPRWEHNSDLGCQTQRCFVVGISQTAATFGSYNQTNKRGGQCFIIKKWSAGHEQSKHVKVPFLLAWVSKLTLAKTLIGY